MYPLIVQLKQPEDAAHFLDQFKKKNPQFTMAEYRISPEKASITIDQIRELKKELMVKSTPRLLVFDDFDMATNEAQNALLKTFEEKSQENQFIVFVRNISLLLPTILSRSLVIRHDDHSFEIDPAVTDLINRISNPGYALLQDPILQPKTNEEAQDFFKKIIYTLRGKVLEGDLFAVAMTKKAFATLSLLESNNLNAQLAVDSWFIAAKRIKIIV